MEGKEKSKKVPLTVELGIFSLAEFELRSLSA